MRVAMYYNNNDIKIEEKPTPKIGRGELLMRVEASGICGSDVMEWYRIKKAPLVLGHEVAGPIEEAGEGVEKFKVGDRIVASHHVPCNTCYYCLTGHHTACDTLRKTNFDPGGFAEYIRLPSINVDRGVFHIPDSVSYGLHNSPCNINTVVIYCQPDKTAACVRIPEGGSLPGKVR